MPKPPETWMAPEEWPSATERLSLWTDGHPKITDEATAAWRNKGWGGISRVDGPWAAAFFDPAEPAIVVAHDPLGLQPLYWTKVAGRVLVAPAVADLLDNPDVEATVSAANVAMRYHHHAAGPAMLNVTDYASIHPVPPGHALVLGRDGSTRLRRFWDPRAVPAASIPADTAVMSVAAAVQDASQRAARLVGPAATLGHGDTRLLQPVHELLAHRLEVTYGSGIAHSRDGSTETAPARPDPSERTRRLLATLDYHRYPVRSGEETVAVITDMRDRGLTDLVTTDLADILISPPAVQRRPATNSGPLRRWVGRIKRRVRPTPRQRIRGQVAARFPEVAEAADQQGRAYRECRTNRDWLITSIEQGQIWRLMEARAALTRRTGIRVFPFLATLALVETLLALPSDSQNPVRVTTDLALQHLTGQARAKTQQSTARGRASAPAGRALPPRGKRENDPAIAEVLRLVGGKMIEPGPLVDPADW